MPYASNQRDHHPYADKSMRASTRPYNLLNILRLSLLALFAFPQLSSADITKNILFLGDSLTAGYGVGAEHAYPALIERRVEAENLPFRIIPAGVSGDTSAGGLRRINWLLKRPVDVLVLALGANDGLRGIKPEAMQSNLQKIIDRVREANPEVELVIAGMKMPPNLGKDYAAEFETVFTDLSQSNDATLIPFLLKGVGGVPKLNQADGIHPTRDGQKIIAETVWQTLRPLLVEAHS